MKTYKNLPVDKTMLMASKTAISYNKKILDDLINFLLTHIFDSNLIDNINDEFDKYIENLDNFISKYLSNNETNNTDNS